MDITCEYCDKSFDSKSKVTAHQKTKKCQQFRSITFVCRNCSEAILGIDNVTTHIDNCKNNKPIGHSEIICKLKDENKTNVFGKGLNGQTIYLYNYEKSILTTGVSKPISESIVNQIETMVEKCTLKSVNYTLTNFSRDAIMREIVLQYPEPFSITDVGRFLEQEPRTVMTFIIATSVLDIFKIILGCSHIIPIYKKKNSDEKDELYVIDTVKRKNNKWFIDWKLSNSKEVSSSLKSFFLPALTYAIKLFVNEGPNHITTKILEYVKELNDPDNVTCILNELAISSLKNYDDVHYVVSPLTYRFTGNYKHTPIDTLVKNIDIQGKNEKQKLTSLILSITKMEDRDALMKKIELEQSGDDDITKQMGGLKL